MNANNTTSIRFEITPQLIELTNTKRILLVLDESQKTKNDSLQARACSALVQHFLVHGKVALLSATPFDQIKHIVNLFRLLGVLTHRSLCTRSGNANGFVQVVDFCRNLNASVTETHIPFELNKKTILEACLNLWSHVIAPRHVFAMSQIGMFREYGEHKNIKNLHCPIDTAEFKAAVQELKSAFSWTSEEMGVQRRNYSRINHALMGLEAAKVPTLIELIKQDLFFYPCCKIIAFCSYRSTIQTLCDVFERFEPLRFEGKMKEEETERSKTLFQDESLKHRLLFANVAKGELGINLHDTHGNRQRRMYIIPTYKNPHQIIGRVYRMGLRSNPRVRFIYGRERTETKILTKLANMKPVMIHTLPQQKKDKMVFPGEYETQVRKDMPIAVKQTSYLKPEYVLWNHTDQWLISAWDYRVYDHPIYIWIHNGSITQSSVYVSLIRKMIPFLPKNQQIKFQKRLVLVQGELLLLFGRGVDVVILDYYDLDSFWYCFPCEHVSLG